MSASLLHFSNSFAKSAWIRQNYGEISLDSIFAGEVPCMPHLRPPLAHDHLLRKLLSRAVGTSLDSPAFKSSKWNTTKSLTFHLEEMWFAPHTSKKHHILLSFNHTSQSFFSQFGSNQKSLGYETNTNKPYWSKWFQMGIVIVYIETYIPQMKPCWSLAWRKAVASWTLLSPGLPGKTGIFALMAASLACKSKRQTNGWLKSVITCYHQHKSWRIHFKKTIWMLTSIRVSGQRIIYTSQFCIFCWFWFYAAPTVFFFCAGYALVLSPNKSMMLEDGPTNLGCQSQTAKQGNIARFSFATRELYSMFLA